MALFGLLGYPLGHSFSKPWFEAQGYAYNNYEYENVETFLENKPSELNGFNVTIPHKENILPFLDEIDPQAKEVGAVNCVKILADGSLKGYNTDIIGFQETLLEMIGPRFSEHAAVLGSGGASKAVCYVLKKIGIDHQVVSRSDDGYQKFDITKSRLIINTTPLGMYPGIDAAPPIDYNLIDSSYFLYDLIYNPCETSFMKQGRMRQATVRNGLSMLHCQARAALRLFVEP